MVLLQIYLSVLAIQQYANLNGIINWFPDNNEGKPTVQQLMTLSNANYFIGYGSGYV